MPPHVSQVGRRLVRDRGRWCPRWRPLRAAGEDAHEFRKADDGADLGARDQAGLRAAAGGDDRDLLAQRGDQRHDAGYPTYGAVEPELTQERQAAKGSRLDGARRGEHAHGDREVETGAALAHA